jgi:hypothetical protein
MPVLRFSHDHFQHCLIFRDHVRGQNAAPVAAGVNKGIAADDAAGVEDAVATDFGEIAEQSAEFAEAGVEGFAVDLDFDVAGERFEIREHHAGADVRFVAEDGVADVIEVRRGGVVEQQRVFQLGGISDDAVVADDDVVADVGVVADLAIATDDGGAFDHGAVFDDGAFADEDILADERDAVAAIFQAGFEVGGEVILDLFERFPGVMAAVEDGGVFGLLQVKQIGWFEHGDILSPKSQVQSPKSYGRLR